MSRTAALKEATLPFARADYASIDVSITSPSAVHDAGLRPVFGNVMFRMPFVVVRFLLSILTVSGGVCGRRTFLGFTTPGNAIRGAQRGVCMASIRESLDLDNTDILWYTAWSICR